jgi:maleate isomerase
MNRREATFLEANDFDIVDSKGLEIEPNIDIGRQVPDTSYRIAKSLEVADADAVLISCTNLRTFEIIEDLERDLGIPVVSSNSATLWSALNHLDVETDDIPLGTLYDHSLAT